MHYQVQSRDRQKGAALILALIFLLLMTLLSTSSMRTATMQERMAGNLRLLPGSQRSIRCREQLGALLLQPLQIAESALRVHHHRECARIRSDHEIPPEQPDALAEALVSVLTDEGLRRRTAAAAVERAEEFSWDRAVDAYETVLGGGFSSVPHSPRAKSRTASGQHAISS